jgi:hypothetical protein
MRLSQRLERIAFPASTRKDAVSRQDIDDLQKSEQGQPSDPHFTSPRGFVVGTFR